MAQLTLLAEAVRGSVQRTVSVGAGNPAHVTIDMVSSVFPTDPTLTFLFQCDRSLDGGVTFTDGFGSGVVSGGQQGQPAGKQGLPGDGLFHQTAQWDGLASTFRVTVTVNTPFSWGLTLTTTAA